MLTPIAIIEAKLRELDGRTLAPGQAAQEIASALADARRADVEVVRAFLRTVQELEPDEVTAALSRLAGET